MDRNYITSCHSFAIFLFDLYIYRTGLNKISPRDIPILVHFRISIIWLVRIIFSFVLTIIMFSRFNCGDWVWFGLVSVSLLLFDLQPFGFRL